MRRRKVILKNIGLIMGIVAILAFAVGIAILMIEDISLYKKANEELAVQQELLKESLAKEKPSRPILKESKEIEVTQNVENVGNLHDIAKKEKGIEEAKKDSNLSKRISFNDLDSLIQNEDVYAWLYVPDTNIDYVVMQGTEEDPLKYLWKDPYGKESKTGSLFINNTGIEDDHTIIYGHRLKDHDIYFGPLLNFTSAEFAKQHEVAYLYGKDSVTRYRLYSVNEGLETDSVYFYPYMTGTPDYDLLIKDVTDNATVLARDSFDQENRMLVLSTCSGSSSGQPQRVYLVYEEDVIFEY